MFQYLQIFYRPGFLFETISFSDKAHTTSLRIAYFFFMVFSFPWSFNYNLFGIESIPLEILIYGIFGLGVFYAFSYAIKIFSRWFGADSDSKQIRTVLGISLIPCTAFCFLVYALITINPNALPLVGMFGIVYCFTIVLISLNKLLKINYLKTYLSVFIALCAVLAPLLVIFKSFFGA